MIIIGYQGIGKSTLARQCDTIVVDLESDNFWIDGKRYDDWYIPYCNIANHISSQGYIVCTSSHKVVRDYLRRSNENVVIAFPSLRLKNDWIDKLKRRYELTGLEKDYKAMMNAIDRYDDNIKELMDEPFEKLIIKDIKYNLKEMLLNLNWKSGGLNE